MGKIYDVDGWQKVLQRVGTGLMSKRTARELDPLIADAEEEERRILAETTPPDPEPVNEANYSTPYPLHDWNGSRIDALEQRLDKLVNCKATANGDDPPCRFLTQHDGRHSFEEPVEFAVRRLEPLLVALIQRLDGPTPDNVTDFPKHA